MRYRLVAVCAVLLLAPSLAGALSLDELQRQVEFLLAQIAQMENKNVSATTSVSLFSDVRGPTYSCITLTRALSSGARGDDVLQLQKYLALNTGIYPEGQTTGYFGPATEAAVKRWQAAHGIVSSGDVRSTGWGVVGARTRAAMANCNTVVAPGSVCAIPPNAPLVDFCKNGTWSKSYDNRGCHVDWRCSGTYVPPLQCPTIPAKPVCSGTYQPVQDANSCILDWKCIPAPKSCPVHAVPACASNFRLGPGPDMENGCPGPKQCVRLN